MLLLILLTVLPHDTALRDSCDVIEINSFFHWKPIEHTNGDVSHQLEFVFTQILFRRWKPLTGTHEIDAWRMRKPEMNLPAWNESLGCYEMRWVDSGVERVIQARTVVESSTDVDPEVAERERWSKEYRADLRRLKPSGKGR